MTTVEVKCPTCNGVQVYKYGKSKNGTQRYLCCRPECPRKTFRLEYRYEGAKPGTNEKIIAMAANIFLFSVGFIPASTLAVHNRPGHMLTIMNMIG